MKRRRRNGFRPLLCWVLPYRFCRWPLPHDCPVHRPREIEHACRHYDRCPWPDPGGCFGCQPDNRAALGDYTTTKGTR